jgi:hypothetical protein
MSLLLVDNNANDAAALLRDQGTNGNDDDDGSDGGSDNRYVWQSPRALLFALHRIADGLFRPSRLL